MISDAQDVTFGIRKITYAVPGSDNLTLSVNGVPVVAKGGDWGMDEAMKRIPRARLEAQIRMHKLANYTIIRNWVGQSTSEDFYDLCDKYGILLWDEFFQPNPSDGPNPPDTALYLANVREKILRFRSHPCIALWCGRNEGFPPPDINTGIQALMDELDTHRLYQPSSTDGRGVHSGGPYRWQTPRAYYRVDAPFKTEIGSVSIPTLEAVQAMMPPKDWETINDDWAEHDLLRGAQAGDSYPVTLGRPLRPHRQPGRFRAQGAAGQLRGVPGDVRGPLRPAVPADDRRHHLDEQPGPADVSSGSSTPTTWSRTPRSSARAKPASRSTSR